MAKLLASLRPAVVSLALFTGLCGLLYPLAVGLLAAAAFPAQAAGSLVRANGQVVGSALVGQPFDEPGYVWGRPSAIGGDAATSGGSNLGPSNPALAGAVARRIAALRAADPAARGPVPVDLVTSSASGLDPDVSPAAAYYQATRVARARGVEVARVRALVAAHVVERTLGVLGERRVNVLALNRALDRAFGPLPPRTPERKVAP